MFRNVTTSCMVLLMLGLIITPVLKAQDKPPEVPIKNVARVEGVRSNQLQGYGVVTGLEGTGDGSINFLNEPISRALSRIGISFESQSQASQASLENIATVMVSAELPPFKKPGDEITVKVSSIGSAEDLTGGVLVQTPLKGADGDVYAVAQGPVSKGGDAENRQLTVASMPNGGIVEREVPYEFTDDNVSLNLQLSRPDFKMADCIARGIDSEYDRDLAKAESAGTVRVNIPSRFRNNPVEFIAELEEIQIHPYKQSRVVINERTGTVVMGGNIVVSNTSVTHGDLTIQVQGDDEEEQPQGDTVRFPESTTIQQMVNSLNSVGASTDAVIAILKSMDEAGTLNVPLKVI